MRQAMPQEIEVWYLIPAIRKELAKIFISKYEMSQKEIADILGLTESAVSQYLKDKRGNQLKFNLNERKIINKTAKKISEDKNNSIKHLYNLCNSLKNTKTICDLHRKHNPKISKDCDFCSMKN